MAGLIHSQSTIDLGATTNPDAEPVFNAGTDTLVFSDGFDTYTSFADASANGWRSKDGGTTQDFSGGAVGGANLIISPGANGTGQAVRLVYTGQDNTGAGQEARSWARSLSDPLLALPANECFVSYDVRITPTSPYHLDFPQNANSRIVTLKWLELWTGTDRAQFSTANSFVNNDIPFTNAGGTGTMWGFYGTASGVNAATDPSGRPPQAGQCRPAVAVGGGVGTDFGGGWAYQGVGKWHHMTHQYRTLTAAGARNGIARVWYDGTLIVAVGSAYAGVAVPNGVGVNGVTHAAQQWCTVYDLDDWFVNSSLSRFTLGSVNGTTQWAFQVDYDNFKLWRHT